MEGVESQEINTGVIVGGGKPMFASEEDRKNEELSCLKIMAFNHKNSKFRDKRTELLDNVKRQMVPTRTKLRIKFPDSYVL
jgi:hypothetical protein